MSETAIVRLERDDGGCVFRARWSLELGWPPPETFAFVRLAETRGLVSADGAALVGLPSDAVVTTWTRWSYSLAVGLPGIIPGATYRLLQDPSEGSRL